MKTGKTLSSVERLRRHVRQGARSMMLTCPIVGDVGVAAFSLPLGEFA